MQKSNMMCNQMCKTNGSTALTTHSLKEHRLHKRVGLDTERPCDCKGGHIAVGT